ncbi:MAG: caspase family protein, partial [Candidatus Poribacteria bacterium]
MVRRSLRLITLLTLVATISPLAGAQTLPPRGFSVVEENDAGQPVEVRLYRRMVAVVIGIDRYQDARHNLRYAVRDAEGIRDTLTEQYGFDPVYTLFDAEATRDNILSLLLTKLPKETTEDDAVWVFCSGHGDTVNTPNGALGYLVPHDGKFQQGQRNISMSTLRDDVSRALPSRHVCFIIDACYGGLLTTRSGAIRTERNTDWLRANVEKRARQVLTAGGEDEQVLDGGSDGYAVYTGRLIEALREADDYITASELAARVGERVFSDAQAQGHKQTPAYGYLSGTGDFVFVPKRTSNAQVEAEIARLEVAIQASRQAQERATEINDAARLTQELQRQAEMEENLRQARAVEAEAEALREADRRRGEDRTRLANEARAAELRRELEQQQAEEDAGRTDMTLSEAATRLSELGKKIAEVEATVRSEIAQEKELVRPASIQTIAKDQFETTAEFGERKRRIDEANASERVRYEREIAAVDVTLE